MNGIDYAAYDKLLHSNGIKYSLDVKLKILVSIYQVQTLSARQSPYYVEHCASANDGDSHTAVVGRRSGLLYTPKAF